METVKLINKKGEIIERLKIQYEPNEKIWTERGWSVYEAKPKPVETNLEPSGDPEWQPEAPKKKKKSKKKAK
jgi:hypothetical protein